MFPVVITEIICMLPSRLIWRCSVIALTLLTQAASAQSRLPSSVVTANSALSDTQHQLIQHYTRDRISRLTKGSNQDILDAREQLIEPLNRLGATALFRLAYSSTASYPLQKALNSNHLNVRLNAIIITAYLTGPNTVSLIHQGLADSSPAVRYRACKAASETRLRSSLSQTDQQTLLDALIETISLEQSEPVRQKILEALAGLTIPQATWQLIELLNNRVSTHLTNSGLTLDTELHVLQPLFVNAVQAHSRNQGWPDEYVRQMALVSSRFFSLAIQILTNHPGEPHSRMDCIKLIQLTNQILYWSVNQLAPNAPQLRPIPKHPKPQDFPEIGLRAQEWKQLLMVTAPFEFSPDQLTISYPTDQ